MPYQQVTHTEHDKEMARWEMDERDVPRGLKPGNPYRLGNEHGKAGALYPRMIYKAARVPPGLPGQGKFACSVAEPRRFGYRDDDEWNAAKQEAQRFTEDCYKVIEDEDAFLKHKGQGWCATPNEAVDLAEKERVKTGNTRAERNWEERNLSDAARAEVDAHDAEHFGHQVDMPEKPIVRRIAKGKGKAGKSASA